MCCCDCPGKNHHHDQQYILSASFLKKLTAYYTQEEVNALIPDLAPYYTQAQVNALLVNYYTQAQVDGLIPDLTPYYTQAQVDALLASYYTKTEVDDLLENPAFLAILSGAENNVTGDGTYYNIPIDSAISNPDNDFSVATHRFHAPVNGVYSLSMRVYIQNISSSHTFAVDAIYTSNRVHYGNERNLYALARSGLYNSSGFTTLADMDAGDVAYPQLYVSGGAKTIGVYGSNVAYTSFSGHLVRRT